MTSGFNGFLRDHHSPKGGAFTHTRIGNSQLGIKGGCYNIPDEDREQFYTLYLSHLKKGHYEYLTEVQGDVAPLLVDLDFRYAVDVEERQHTSSMVSDLIGLYMQALSRCLDIKEGTVVNAYAFEKPNINCCEGITKDGIHLVIGIPLDRASQCLVRDYVKCEIADVVNDLPLENDTDGILDEGITLGGTNWQLVGSRKPANEAYELVQANEWCVSEDGDLMRIKGLPTSYSGEDAVRLHQNLSARRFADGKTEPFPVSDGSAAAHATWVNRFAAKSAVVDVATEDASLCLTGFTPVSITTPTIGGSVAEIEAAYKEFMDRCDQGESLVYSEAAKYTMCLTVDYADDHDKWFKVGLALRHTHRSMFVVWMMFSTKSSKFRASDVASYAEQWANMTLSAKTTGRQITAKSIMYWARTSNPDAYYDVNEKSISSYMAETLRGPTEYDIAQVLYCKFSSKYKCVSIKSRLWYQYVGHRWTECDGGHGLRHNISAWLATQYLKKTQEIVNKTLQCQGDNEESATLQKQASKYSEIALLLKKTTYKDHVMRECCELFYDPDFLNLLDTNPNLLCFDNGIYDFGTACFRPGQADDYVSLCTHTTYPKDGIDATSKLAVNNFMTQLFPDTQLREYMWDHLASVLPGLNEAQTFSIYSGIGSNGKSKLVELMNLVLGDYKGTVPITMVVGNRTNIGSASPEIAQLKGKRYAVMQEPTKGDKINEGILKEMTGSDPVQGRALYKDTVTYVPQFTLVVCCNDLPTFKSNDEGTWRRVRLCRFMSCFVSEEEEEEKKKENPSIKHWFRKDLKLGDAMKIWVSAFTRMLVERWNETRGKVRDCESVRLASKQYRNDEDVLVLFHQECIREQTGTWLSIGDAWLEFQEWHRSTYPSRRRMPEKRELRESLERAIGPYGGEKKGHTRGWKNWTACPAGEPSINDYDE